VYIQGEALYIAEYSGSDRQADYDDWNDEETQSGFNFAMEDSFEEFAAFPRRQRWYAAIVRRGDDALLGFLMLSPEGSEPDLAIRVLRRHRAKGYGKEAFRLGALYCIQTLGIGELHAGCYPHNTASMRVIATSGFEPNPKGNLAEKNFRTGEAVTQLDFVLREGGRLQDAVERDF